jgi:hypothetical protein
MSSDTALALGGISFTAAAVVLKFLALGPAAILVNIVSSPPCSPGCQVALEAARPTGSSGR